MSLNTGQTVNKFIVDSTRPLRDREVVHTVRRTRDRLSQTAGNPDFDREMLKIHARAIISSAPAILLLVLAIGGAGFAFGLLSDMLLWALLTGSSFAGLFLLSQRVEKLALAEMDAKGLQMQYLAFHFLSGTGWAYLVALDCPDCGFTYFPALLAIVLLMAIAATAVIASSLRGATIVTFALPVATYALLYADLPLDVESILAVLLVVSLPFFSYVAHHRNQVSVSLLSFRSEKDALIAELETAKAVSDEARRRAEEANLAKSRFLASISHELRTPLNAILGFSEVMAKEVLGPINNQNYREYANDVHESGKHLLELINEILDLSRIEAGRYQLNEEPLDLAEVVQECCRMMALKLRSKDIRLIQQFEPALPRLLADERAVRQISLNLLSNAIKFSPSGGEVRVRVGWTAGGGQYLAIKDDGPGIPEEEMPVVLSAFGQGSIAIKSAEQGTGLGLPIVQGLASLHGGVLELKSKLREGTEAIVAFPATRVMEELPAIPTARAAGGARA